MRRPSLAQRKDDMTTVRDAVVASQQVEAPADRVYAFARRMDNLPRWASGLASGIEQQQGEWFADSPMGKVRVAMVPENAFGVLDHVVGLPDGTEVYNAFRVTPCGADRSLLSFVVLRFDGVDEKAFDRDVEHVRRDLLALKQLMEGAPE
ncbi:Polyketide cyclase / dehydrase and lipid transport [Burkholderiales bacterium 8X]|nr:Polyketide cyclase / dehydrase and lipid transport [Burkholderiales bacterium 8X]